MHWGYRNIDPYNQARCRFYFFLFSMGSIMCCFLVWYFGFVGEGWGLQSGCFSRWPNLFFFFFFFFFFLLFFYFICPIFYFLLKLK